VNPDRGLIDTSAVIAFGGVDSTRLPAESAISTLTLAELTTGPHATDDAQKRAQRQDLLQRVEAEVEPLPFDVACARAFGQVCAATAATGRRVGRSRIVDLMIASTALAHQMPLYTLNADDLRGLEGLIDIVDVSAS
jgi:predicted nucleic acid-binding protein